MMRRFLEAAMSRLRVGAVNPAIVPAQFFELQRQIPFLYALLVVNASAAAYTHYGLAPDFLTVGVPVILLAVCGGRLLFWLKLPRERVDPIYARRQLRRTTFLSVALSIGYVTWAIALDGYGGMAERGHIALFIAITVIACIFCLTHLPMAALLVTFAVTVPYVWHYWLSDIAVFRAMAVNILLVSAVMIRVLLGNFRAFVQLEESRSTLACKHMETLSLSEENALLASTDSLTGLPNRRHFFERLDGLLARAEADGQTFALGIFDLDGFKGINDTHGHVVGDKLLVEVARRLKGLCDERILAARLGGDEFAILMEDGVDRQAVAAFGSTLCDALRQPFTTDGIQLLPGCSCGFAVYPAAGETATLLFDRADYALYHSKSRSRGSATVFSIEHETTIRKERAVETALQRADLEAELEVHFQPIVDLVHGGDVAMEALARWTSPSLGAVPPVQFIAIAERTGLIHALTLCLFRKALHHARLWPSGIGLSFNLSARDVASSQTVLAVIAAVRQAGLSPARITFELTETAMLEDIAVTVQSIHLLRSFGCRVALDDFGTGYASLSTVHRLKFDMLKTDRSFLSDIKRNAEGRNIIKTALYLCDNLGLDCVVEGAETAEDVELLRELGCRYAQGYFLGRPMPADEAARRMARNAPASRARPFTEMRRIAF